MTIAHTFSITLLLASSACLVEALDHNKNGVSDVWESLYPAAVTDWNGDFDQDGQSNFAEGRAFTNPEDPESFFSITTIEGENGSMNLGFPGEPWMRDLTEESQDLVSWTRQGGPQVSDGSPTVLQEEASEPRKFYRRVRHNALNSDTDALTNKEEELLGTDPLNWDSDGDKVADDIEFLIGTDPLTSADTDGDGLPDDFERWCLSESGDDAFVDLEDINVGTDFDGDSVTDGQEFTLGTSPVVPLKNVLFFITEDQSVHLGVYDTNPAGGYAGTSADPAENTTTGLDTPHLDALGNRGIIFDRAFCLSPVCSPSKMALFTGTFPHTNSAHRNVWNYGVNFPLPANEDPSLVDLGGVHEDLPTLIEVFRDRGWYTAVSSKSHTQPIRKFPWHEGHPNLGTPLAAANAMNAVITDAGDRPFFFWANVGSPHLPFRATPRVNGAWDDNGGLTGDGGVTNIDVNAIDVPNCYPDVPGVRQDIADYLGSIKVVDGIVQACIDTIENRGIADETLIIFTSDHGLGLHRAKQSIYSTGTQIPFLVAGPDVTGSRRIRQPISHLDVAPTLIDFIGMPQLPSHLGKSLRPLFEGQQDEIPERKTMLTASHRYATARAVTDGRYYYVHNITKPTGTLANPALALNTDQWQGGAPWYNRTYDATLATDSPQRDLLLQTVTGEGLPEFELFDLDQDLWCVNNLIDDPSLAEVRRELHNELVRWRTATEDYNSNPSEMTRRTQRYVPLQPVAPVPDGGGLTFGDDFDSDLADLGTADSWTSTRNGNNDAPFSIASGLAQAAGGPLTLATFEDQTLTIGAPFKVTVRTGFDGTGVSGGIAFGIADNGFWQFMLSDGRSAAGGFDKDLRLVRNTLDNQANTLLNVTTLSNYASNGDLFTLEVSGQEGSQLVSLKVLDPVGRVYFQNAAFDLGAPVPVGSKFGLTTASSNSSIFDDFSVTISGPRILIDEFDGMGSLSDAQGWELLLAGNNGADFTHVAAPFGISGTAIKAPAGPLGLASYDPLTFGDGQEFEITLDVGYPNVGIFGGLAFGLTDQENYYTFELADGLSSNALANMQLFRIRRSNAGTLQNVLLPTIDSLPLISRDRFYRLSLSGTVGQADISYTINDISTTTTLASGTLTLPTSIPSGSRVGLISNSSAATHFDQLTIILE